MSRNYCVVLPRGATGLSAVCDCGTPDRSHLLCSAFSRSDWETPFPLLFSKVKYMQRGCVFFSPLIYTDRSLWDLPLHHQDIHLEHVEIILFPNTSLDLKKKSHGQKRYA